MMAVTAVPVLAGVLAVAAVAVQAKGKAQDRLKGTKGTVEGEHTFTFEVDFHSSLPATASVPMSRCQAAIKRGISAHVTTVSIGNCFDNVDDDVRPMHFIVKSVDFSNVKYDQMSAKISVNAYVQTHTDDVYTYYFRNCAYTFKSNGIKYMQMLLNLTNIVCEGTAVAQAFSDSDPTYVGYQARCPHGSLLNNITLTNNYMIECAACAANWYHDVARDRCVPCDEGFYTADSRGQLACKPKPPGYREPTPKPDPHAYCTSKPGFRIFGNHGDYCFKLDRVTKKTFKEAHEDCKARGAQLYQTRTDTEVEWLVMAFIMDASGDYREWRARRDANVWTDAVRDSHLQAFHWPDGTDLPDPSPLWAPGEPRSEKRERYLAVNIRAPGHLMTTGFGRWMSSRGSVRRFFACFVPKPKV